MNKIKTLFIITLTIGSIFINGFGSFNNIKADSKDNIDNSENSLKDTKNLDSNSDEWYYLPAYPNYAPKGLPDFDEKQNESWFRDDGWPLFCGACALANIFWWFDSKHEDSNGYPGDGKDTYPLVKNYNAPVPSNPGPYSDDHNYNNVDDNRTQFNRFRRNGELIEQIAWYASRHMCFPLWWKLHPFQAMDFINLYNGAKKWLLDVDLQNQYTVQLIFKPSFYIIDKYVRDNSGVILVIVHCRVVPQWKNWGHYVAVAGINSSGQIALSDSIRDAANPSLDPAEHNDASIVSHDIWNVNFTTPYPQISSWWLPNYTKYGVTVNAAIIITEKK
jgi:hypothetical protein